jgi:uncharacterized iron-regulated membrane protein
MRDNHRKTGGGAVVYTGLLVVLHDVIVSLTGICLVFICFMKSIMNKIFKKKNNSVKGTRIKYDILVAERFTIPVCVSNINEL